MVAYKEDIEVSMKERVGGGGRLWQEKLAWTYGNHEKNLPQISVHATYTEHHTLIARVSIAQTEQMV